MTRITAGQRARVDALGEKKQAATTRYLEALNAKREAEADLVMAERELNTYLEQIGYGS